MTAAGKDPLLCMWPEVVAPYVSTPLFVMNSKIDPALDSIIAGEGGGNVSNVNRIAAELVSLVQTNVVPSHKNAAFITSWSLQERQTEGRNEGKTKR